MANQYRSALDEAAYDLRVELDKHNIVVDGLGRTVSWRGVKKTVPAYTDMRTCRRTLKRFIVAAVSAERKEYLKNTQGKLL